MAPPKTERPDYDLTALEFAVRHPKRLTREHYIIVLEAMIRGEKIRKEVLDQYPVIVNVLSCYAGLDSTRELERLLRNAQGNRLAPRRRK